MKTLQRIAVAFVMADRHAVAGPGHRARPSLPSENLWFDPTPYLTRKELTVYVDGANYRRHHVDVSFLPRLAA